MKVDSRSPQSERRTSPGGTGSLVGIARESRILQSLLEGVIVVNAEGIVVAVNRSAQLLYGNDGKLSPGIPFAEYAPQDWVEVKRVLASGRPQTNRILTMRHAEILINRVPLLHDGRVCGVVCTMQDIATYDAVAHSLPEYRRLHDEFEAVIEQQDDAIIVVDAQRIIVRVNTAFESLIALGRQALTGRDLARLRRDPLGTLALVESCREKQTRVCSRAVHPDGTPYVLCASPSFDEEGALSLIVCRIQNASALPPEQSSEQEDTAMPAGLEEGDEKIRKLCAASGFVVHSQVMCQVVRQALKVSRVESSVLVQGESGVGKSMLASLIHSHSPRKDRPFIVINCGAIPEALMESELFGYEKGAFTGAAPQGKVGLLEAANGGTVFFDEVGELKFPLQVKLLEVIEKKSFMRVGGTKRISVDIRIIAATNRNLEEDVRANLFRKDLFYRLNVIPLRIPPLREHPEDIVAMAEDILAQRNARYSMQKRLSSSVMRWLMHYPFPGNARELVNVMEWMLVMSEGEVITRRDLPASLQPERQDVEEESLDISEVEPAPRVELPEPEGILPLKDAMRFMEENYLRRVIAAHHKLQDAADALGIHFSTLWRKMSMYGIKTEKD